MTAEEWAAMTVAERVGLLGGVEEVGEAIVERLAAEGIVVESVAGTLRDEEARAHAVDVRLAAGSGG
jgi:hypothetical protein